MSKFERLLSQYAAYHLDRKNVLTHFVGIPLIVFSIMCLTARAGLMISGFELTLALLLIIASVIYYLSLDKIFGLIMLLVFAVTYPLALMIAKMSLMSWLIWSVGIFVVGWIIQFIGHYYEKKKPAFMDDVIGLAIGPLFVLAEFVFLLGFRKELEQRMLTEARRQRAEMDAKALHIAQP
ncbi:Mpo1-like protein [Acinetobacter sp.]|uniref:Mpo1 family 2-hydroxy fatty acid dioxygenase n=1 Tax=Acinetobacter sp. TaxID=472 RepID=UPI0028AA1BA6|nr:Mpo1-like protein [Acinetobacter sp.]